MSMFTSIIFGSGNKEDQAQEQEEDEPPLETQLPIKPFATQPEPTHVSFPSMPVTKSSDKGTTGGNLSRFRSLSKAFTSLPNTLPNATQILADQLEFWCHVLLLESDSIRFLGFMSNMEQTMEWLCSTDAKQFLKFGRLHSRTVLASLISDVMCLGTTNDNENLTNACELPSDRWESIVENLKDCKKILLRKNADSLENTNDQTDEKLEQHEMMTEDYKDVEDLLKVQIALAAFREQLSVKVSGSFLTPGSTKKREIKHIEDSVSNYRKRLKEILGDDIPHELDSFIVGDLYAPKEQPHAQHRETVSKLIKHICKTISSHGTFSLVNLQQKMRSLLLKWSESILSTPVLFQLGYGGVPSMVIHADDDDVSSWGGEENMEEGLTKRGRSRSFEKRVAKKSPRRSVASPKAPQVSAEDAKETESLKENKEVAAAIVRTPRLPPEMRPAGETKKIQEAKASPARIRREVAVAVLSDAEDDDEEPVVVVKMGRDLAARMPLVAKQPPTKRKIPVDLSDTSEDESPPPKKKMSRRKPVVKKTPPKKAQQKQPFDDEDSSDEETPRVVKYSRRVTKA